MKDNVDMDLKDEGYWLVHVVGTNTFLLIVGRDQSGQSEDDQQPCVCSDWVRKSAHPKEIKGRHWSIYF